MKDAFILALALCCVGASVFAIQMRGSPTPSEASHAAPRDDDLAAQIAAEANQMSEEVDMPEGTELPALSANEPSWSNPFVALRQKGELSEEKISAAHPEADCFDYWGEMRVCELAPAPSTMCLSGIHCSSIAFGFRDDNLISSRMLLPELVWQTTLDQMEIAYGPGEVNYKPVRGPGCRAVRMTTFNTPEGRALFEQPLCSNTAHAYFGAGTVLVLSIE